MGDGAGAVATGASTGATGEAQAQQTAQTQNQTEGNPADAAKEQKPTGRQRVLDRYARLNPDRKFEGENADDDLFNSIADDFDKNDKDKEEWTKRKTELDNLFKEFPESGAIFREMALHKTHPMDYIIDNYGEDVAEALKSKEGRESLKKHRTDREENERKRKAADDAQDANFRKTLDTLSNWGKKRGLKDEQQVERFLKMRDLFNEFADGNISEETFESFYRGMNYDRDVAAAREEGEVNGRNAKIAAEFQQSRERSSKGAPTLSGQGGSSEERDMRKESNVLKMFGINVDNKK